MQRVPDLGGHIVTRDDGLTRAIVVGNLNHAPGCLTGFLASGGQFFHVETYHGSHTAGVERVKTEEAFPEGGIPYGLPQLRKQVSAGKNILRVGWSPPTN